MHALMSESNNSRIEAEECLRKANSCDDSRDRLAWRVLAESWRLLAEINEIVESRKSVEANKSETASAH
jgi:CRISPR/Cas system-associated protein Csm6